MTVTATQSTGPDYDATYERYKWELDALELFRYAERGHRSSGSSMRGTGWMKQIDQETGKLMVAMGRLVATRRTLLDVAMAVLRSVNPHSSRAEWEAKLFESAREALSHDYDDVERRSGPESVRQRDCVRPYSREEKLIVLETLASLCRSWIGVGWAAQRLADELNCSHTVETLTGKDFKR